MRKALAVLLILSFTAGGKEKKQAELSPLDLYIQQALGRAAGNQPATPGSVWNANALLSNLVRDPRATQVDDVITILVAERASATSSGTTQTARKSQAKNSITAIAGTANTHLANLAAVGGDTTLQGQGATSRESTLLTTLTARVTHVLPNGNLVVEGTKDSMVNSERQVVTVRGVARIFDISPGNLIRSDRLSQLEVRINGKGVVNDAIRRPNILYRILLGILPF